MKKLITLFTLIASSVMAQYVPVQYGTSSTALVYGGTNGVFTNVIGYASGMFKPAYASLKATTSPFLIATSMSLSANGVLVSGTVTNTWVEDSSYLRVNGANTWTNFFYFTNSAMTAPRLLNFHGRYDGVLAHTIKFKAFDWTNSIWTNFTAATDDLDANTVDEDRRFAFPSPIINFTTTNGAIWVAIEKTGAADRDLYTDLIQLTFATGIATNGGDWYNLAGFAVGQSNNMTPNGVAGSITAIDAGDYEVKWSVSFIEQTNTQFAIRHLTNGVATGTQSIRTIGSESQVGSMSALGGGRQSAGTTNTWQWQSSTDDAWISFVNGTAKVSKESD